MNLPLESLVLESDKITLEPLQEKHADSLFDAGNYDELWRWVLPNYCETKEIMQDWVRTSLAFQDEGKHLPFIIRDNKSQKIIGTTRYCSIDTVNRALEIGFTFITPQFQRTYVNSHAKFMLLRHAFENLGAVRVQFCTNEKNHKSRSAIARIGAQFEGILRHNRILGNGDIRNTAIFSITHLEWPTVKTSLATQAGLN